MCGPPIPKLEPMLYVKRQPKRKKEKRNCGVQMKKEKQAMFCFRKRDLHHVEKSIPMVLNKEKQKEGNQRTI